MANLKNYTLLGLLWLVMTIIANPIGEFPLNDDWAYYKDVLLLINTGHVHYVDNSAMTLFSQIIIGAGFSKLFGFSFTLLRCLTIFTGYIGILLAYKIISFLTKNDKTALFCSLMIISNPVFFWASNTFMTDIYFNTFSLASLYFYYRSFYSTKWHPIIFGTIFIIIATLIRQIGICIPISYAMIYYYRSSFTNKSTLWKCFLPPILTIIILVIFNYWFSISKTRPSSYFSLSDIISSLGSETFVILIKRLGLSGMTLGLFLFPLLIFLFPGIIINFWNKENKLSLVLTALIIPILIITWPLMPIGNILYNAGLGSKLLKDAYIFHKNIDPVLSTTMLNIIKAVGFLGAITLFYAIFSFLLNLKSNQLPAQKNKLFALIIAILLFSTFIIPVYFFFDRYLIQLIIPIMIVLIPFNTQINYKGKIAWLSYSMIFIFMICNSCLLHDYFAWNKARWKALNYLVTDLKISPNDIEGGFEFDGWYKYSNPAGWHFKDEVINEKYNLAFGPFPGYKTFKLFPYKQYLPSKEKFIYVLYKNQ